LRSVKQSHVTFITIATLLISFSPGLIVITPSQATVSTTVASVYVDAPFVQGSYARHHGGVTEEFNGLSNGSISSNTHSIVGGTKSSGQFTVFANNSTYGASTTSETATVNGTGTKFANTDSTGFEITFSTPVKYIGFFWAAGNSGNSVTLSSGSTDIATYTTTDLTSLLGSLPANYAAATDSITATNGSRYLKKYYFGPPNGHATQTPTSPATINYNAEPYAYVHAFARNDESFDKIKFFGSGFEFDNLTVSTQEVPIRTSLVLVNDVTTTLTLGQSNWNFKGVTTSDSSTVSTGWVSDSSTVVSSNRISVEQTLSISSGTITMGRTALFRTPISNAASNTCGSSFTLVDSYTATNSGYRDILLADNGSASRDLFIRGFCYKWTLDPSSSIGSGAIRPTSSAANTRFNSNLESPMIIIPEVSNDSCTGAGSLVNGNFENLPSGITTQNASSNGPPNPAFGTWHGYASNSNPKQILFLLDADDPSASTFKIDGWRTTATDNLVEIQRVVAGFARTNASQNADAVGIRPASGNFHAELAANQLSTLFQDVSTIPGTTIRWSLKHRARAGTAADSMQVRIGSTDSQTAQTVTSRRSPNNNVYDTPTYTTAVDSPFTETTTISTTLANGWREYRGAYVVPAGQNTTRFAFAATAGTSSGGNLLDDIQFSPLIACPATLSVIAGRQVTINSFDIDGDGNPLANDIIDSYGWTDAFLTETLTATAGTIARSNSNRSISYTAPSTAGSQTINFQIANPQGDTSRSRYTINVIPDTGSRAPDGLPVDPRSTAYKLGLPQVTSATGSVLACLQEMNSSGDTITGTIRFDVGTYGSAQDTLTVLSDTVTLTVAGTSTDRTNYLRVSGPIASVNKALEGLRLTRTNNAIFKGTYYLRFSSVVTGLITSPDSTNCDGAISSAKKDITLRPMTLYEVRRKVLPLVNGKT